MSKLSKLLFIGLLLFTGLYFFGDFKVNKVNIRDYMQQTVTVENFELIKLKIARSVDLVRRIYTAVGNEIESFSEEPAAVVKKKKKEPKMLLSIPDTIPKLEVETPQNTVIQKIQSTDRQEMQSLLKEQLGKSIETLGHELQNQGSDVQEETIPAIEGDET
ncbi:MAG: hypothetical protein ABII18_12960 [bacterium]|nr:hypothetical protein [bacterium]MBU1916889.1 hypothetical protein [bacterium]